MLRETAPFPHVGAEAFLRKTAAKLRIVRDNGDGTMLCAFVATRFDPRLGRIASGTRTISLRDLFATETEAYRGKRDRRTRRRKAA